VATECCAPKWKRSRCSRVANRVSVVKTNTVGTAIRPFAHVRACAPATSRATADQYAAPRKTAVIGEAMVQEKYSSVRVGNTNS